MARVIIPEPHWTTLPEAAAILATFASRPPRTRMVKVVGLSTYYERQYIGDRVRRLNAIYRAEGERLLKLAHASDRYDDLSAHCALTVQEAVAGVGRDQDRRAA